MISYSNHRHVHACALQLYTRCTRTAHTYLLWQRSDVRCLNHPEAAPLYHGGPSHANITSLCRNDHITDSKERGVACEAIPTRHTH